MFKVVPRVQYRVAPFQRTRDLVDCFNVIGDLSRTNVVRSSAGLVKAVREGRAQLQQPVMVASDVDGSASIALKEIEQGVQDSAQVLNVDRERTGF